MKKSLQLIILGALFITAIGHAQWTKIKGNGKVITEKRTTAGYDEVNVSCFFDVVPASEKEDAITIKGEKNLLPYVKVEVKDNVLKFYTEKNINSNTKQNLVLIVPFEQISAASVFGSGDVESKNTIVATNLKAKLSDSGDLTLNVKAKDDFEANLNGCGDAILTRNTDSFTTKISGSGEDAIIENKKSHIQFEYRSFYFDYFIKRLYLVFSEFQIPDNII